MILDTYVILSEQIWNQSLVQSLSQKNKFINWILIDDNKDFNITFLEQNHVTKIFIPHWSYIIPEKIYLQYECILFHMTDLPYGRGGSPLQNLIVRGHTETKISALKVIKELDAGPIYLKSDLSLLGTAQEIFIRANSIVEAMIIDIIKAKLKPVPQVGGIVEFKRRKPEESNIVELDDLEKVYDYIRMLDCEAYPHAFFETPHLKFEFINANFDTNEEIITANVRISKK